MKDISEISTHELLMELNKRGSSTHGTGILKSRSNSKILNHLIKNPDMSIGIALTYGFPVKLDSKTHKCSRCNEIKTFDNFSYYLSRIGGDGYLMRSNSLCNDCQKLSNKIRLDILTEAALSGLIPDKPKSGDICESCEREWHGNWHRHHDEKTKTFVSWICGHCNMSLSEQRGIFINKDSN